MNVRDAVAAAKNWVKEMLSDEGVSNIGLEEVQHDDGQGVWYITVGFSRPWNTPKPSALSALTDQPPLKRAYRVIAVREPNGEVISMKKREDDAA
jgi:hypothetical protein